MDLDTTRNKDGYEAIIDAFSSHKADILVGTQMVTKGLDFGAVSSVVVINADELINNPDFKASERAYNMLEQVSGRAGRGEAEGNEVIIQTYTPEHPILKFVANHNYIDFFNFEIDIFKTPLNKKFKLCFFFISTHVQIKLSQYLFLKYSNKTFKTVLLLFI